MTCSAPAASYGAYFPALLAKARRLRTPLGGSLDLTHRCVLRCEHCYARSSHGAVCEELPTERVLALLDEIAHAGGLHLVLSGGDPLLRPDFAAVYTRARQNGFLVVVFTSGVLVTGEHAALFRELPPRYVEMTVHGATPASYDHITAIPGAFSRFLAGVERLLAAGVSVRLKTTITRSNVHELDAMEEMARSFGVPFRVDPAIFPRLDGDRSPLGLRIPPETAVGLELRDPQRRAKWQVLHERARRMAPLRSLFDCDAGIVNYHIDPRGRLTPCLMVGEPWFDLRTAAFEKGWSEVLPKISSATIAEEHPCRRCQKRAHCGYCPGLFALETGTPSQPSSYLCALGELRYRTLSLTNR